MFPQLNQSLFPIRTEYDIVISNPGIPLPNKHDPFGNFMSEFLMLRLQKLVDECLSGNKLIVQRKFDDRNFSYYEHEFASAFECGAAEYIVSSSFTEMEQEYFINSFNNNFTNISSLVNIMRYGYILTVIPIMNFVTLLNNHDIKVSSVIINYSRKSLNALDCSCLVSRDTIKKYNEPLYERITLLSSDWT